MYKGEGKWVHFPFNLCQQCCGLNALERSRRHILRKFFLFLSLSLSLLADLSVTLAKGEGTFALETFFYF